MDSFNSVLQKFFNLPPAMRMILAVAGFGSLATIVYFLLPALATRQGRIWMLIIALIALVVVLLIYGIRRLFWGRKSSRLAGALETQGPTRGDVAQQEQIYREKFRAKLTDLRTNGLSVYKLPWFVLIGEPGCGKTASLIHSGLDFPLGKDEVPGFGGTRNYNWWFTNDAVILDTAGRIAFQEEGTTDKVEWEYFLKLLRANRPRCPINGIIVALPADKLLRDTAEERAQKATVLRERLRQMHQALGVRFPTFLLVTKMDLVGGFGEFFEEVRVDLQQRNQMFGWSRPGEFQEPFDPGVFPDAFDEVYFRLREWSMRYLQRKATDEELGLVVTFPEAYRQLREPLGDYINTVFQKSPLLEPPFFRGFYFTSAVQEGAPIFDVLTRARRGGVVLPERPTKAVDSKAFFIHDFYARKVFAEHGLVFRSAQHVTLNQRMRRIVWVGSAIMVVLMLLLFAFGSFSVSTLVTRPGQDCKVAVDAISSARQQEPGFDQLAERLQLAKRLREHYQAYERPWTWLRARALFIGANIAVPRDDVRLIHARYVLDTIVRPILRESERRLASADEAKQSPERYQRYVAAAAAYARWYADAVGEAGRRRLERAEAGQRGDELGKLLLLLNQPEPIRKDAVEQFTAALQSLAAQPRSFGREILVGSVKLDAERATGLLKAVAANLAEAWLPQTRLVPAPQDKFLVYWYGLAQKLGDLQGLYDETLKLADGFQDAGAYKTAAQRFLALTDGVDYLGKVTQPPPEGTLARAYYDLAAFLSKDNAPPQTDAQRIRRFKDQLAAMDQKWDLELAPLLDALKAGAPKETEPPQNAVYAAFAQTKAQLRQGYEKSCSEIREKLRVPPTSEPLDVYAGQLKLLKVVERAEGDLTFESPRATLELAPEPLGHADELRSYLAELRQTVSGEAAGELGYLTQWPQRLMAGQASAPAGTALGQWLAAARRAQEQPTDETVRQTSGLADDLFWRPEALFALARAILSGNQARTVGAMLQAMETQCDAAAREKSLPGLARFMPGYDKPLPEKLPFRRCALPTEAPNPVEPAKAAEPTKPAQPEEGDWRRRRTTPEEPVQPQGGPRARAEELPPLVAYHTRDLFGATLKAYYDVRTALDAQAERGKPVIAALDRSADAYIDAYFSDWNGVYDSFCELLDEDTLRFLQACAQGQYDWPAFDATLEKQGGAIADALAVRLEALVREVVLVDDGFEQDKRGNALVERVDARLEKLGPQGNLLRRLDDIGRRAATLRRTGDPVAQLGDGLVKAWRDYVQQVKRRGPDPKGVEAPHDRQQLRAAFEELIPPRTLTPDQFALSAPLIDIAAYGETLLAQYLDGRLAAVCKPDEGRYPVVADARDSETGYPRLARLAGSALSPDEVLKLLRDLDRFQQDYGKLLRALHQNDAGNPYVRALDLCAAWINFFYGTETSRINQVPPSPLKVKWTITTHKGTTAAGNIYDKVTIALPLLDTAGRAAVGAVDRDARSGFGRSLSPDAGEALAKQDWDYRWSLFQGVDYPRPTVRVSGKNATAKAEYPSEIVTNWQLPGSAWALLLLVGADPGNRLSGEQWVIPVQMTHGSEAIGFDIAVQFERAVPDPLAPPADPGRPQRMTAAERYLSDRPAPRP